MSLINSYNICSLCEESCPVTAPYATAPPDIRNRTITKTRCNSHELVTIPTAGWIDAAHRHGTRVLGTFITEWDKGYDVCESSYMEAVATFSSSSSSSSVQVMLPFLRPFDPSDTPGALLTLRALCANVSPRAALFPGAELLRSEETADRAAAKLTQIAVDHGFDGWLVNIENQVDPGKKIDVMVHFLKSLTAQMRAAKSPNVGAAAAEAAYGYKEDWTTNSSGESGGASGGYGPFSSASLALNSGSTVLWYDSVGVDGKLEWQDRLNEKNRVFFNACDGIFTNYAWEADYPSACALEATARRYGCGSCGCCFDVELTALECPTNSFVYRVLRRLRARAPYAYI